MAASMPEYMTMGHDGMGGMGEMDMPIPEEQPADARRPGPFGYIDMGGMFTVLKVRDAGGWGARAEATTWGRACGERVVLRSAGCRPARSGRPQDPRLG
jgi:hypothetical protein